jgi:hypothetical protein
MRDVNFLGRVGSLLLLGASLFLIGPVASSAVALTASHNHGGVVSNYTSPSINQPEAIAAAPNDALWFTSFGACQPL